MIRGEGDCMSDLTRETTEAPEAGSLIAFDRTRATTDWACPRRRFWAFEFGGRGLSPRRMALPLHLGILIHETLPVLVMGGNAGELATSAERRLYEALRAGDQIAEASDEDFAREQSYIIAGMIYGAARVVVPKLLAEYEPVSVEEELTLPYGRCLVLTKPDLLMRRREDRSLWYHEWKSTSNFSPSWFASWQRAPQIHLTALNIERARGEELAGTIVHGLYKGQKRDGRQLSIFAYGYSRRNSSDILATYANGSVRVPLWTVGITPREWAELIPEEVLEEQFAQAPPVFLDRHIVEEFLAEREEREVQIRETREALATLDPASAARVMRRVFPRHFNQCEPAYGGSRCAFTNPCWVPQLAADPLRSGEFVWREPHHATEELEA